MDSETHSVHSDSSYLRGNHSCCKVCPAYMYIYREENFDWSADFMEYQDFRVSNPW